MILASLPFLLVDAGFLVAGGLRAVRLAAREWSVAGAVDAAGGAGLLGRLGGRLFAFLLVAAGSALVVTSSLTAIGLGLARRLQAIEMKESVPVSWWIALGALTAISLAVAIWLWSAARRLADGAIRGNTPAADSGT